MSRVGKRTLKVPAGVKVIVDKTAITVNGKLGELKLSFSPLISVMVEGDNVTLARANEEKATKALHGTTNALIANMLHGVSEGYKKEMLIEGVGYKAAVKGDKLEVLAGYSHPVILDIAPGTKIEVNKAVEITVTGISKQTVGQMAANIRNIAVPNPYSGKGVLYKGERIRRKVGKATTK